MINPVIDKINLGRNLKDLVLNSINNSVLNFFSITAKVEDVGVTRRDYTELSIAHGKVQICESSLVVSQEVVELGDIHCEWVLQQLSTGMKSRK